MRPELHAGLHGDGRQRPEAAARAAPARTGTGGTLAAGSGPGSGCAGTVSKTFGCVPAGCTITVQTLACPIGVGAPPGGGGLPAPPPPGVLAQLAVRYLRLPDPVIRSSPAPGALQLTELPTWLWVAPAVWQPRVEDSAGPRRVGHRDRDPGVGVLADGRRQDGHLPRPRHRRTPRVTIPRQRSPTCGYTYTRSSAGQPHAAYHVTATITWDITWTGPGGAGGALPPLFTAAAAAMRVAESQAVNTAGGA